MMELAAEREFQVMIVLIAFIIFFLNVTGQTITPSKTKSSKQRQRTNEVVELILGAQTAV